MRHAYLILAVISSYILLRGWPEPWPIAGRIFCAATLILIALGLLAKASSTHTRRTIPARARGLMDAITIAMALAVTEFSLVAFFSTAPEEAEKLAGDFEYYLHPTSGPQSMEEGTRGDDESGVGVVSGEGLARGYLGRDLLQTKQLLLSNRPDVYLWPERPEDLAKLLHETPYLRTYSLANYTKGRWEPLTQTPRTLLAEDRTVTIRQNVHPKETLRCTIYHLPNLGSQSLLVSPPGIVTATVDSLRQTGPDCYRLPPLPADQTSYRYQTSSTPLILEELPDENEISPDRTNLDPAYLKPATDPKTAKAIANIAKGINGDTRELLQGIVQHLKKNHRYSLNPKYDNNLTSLENFLIGSREGYCDHFSTAAALLARSLGIPARVAYGWSGGRFYSSQKMIVFRGREAHAWAEVHLAGYGWVILETTPPDRGEAIASRAGQDEMPPPSDGLTFETPEEEDLAPIDSAILKPIALAATGVAGIGLLGLLLLRREPTSDQEFSILPGLLPKTPSYLALFRQGCAQAGFPMAPGTTLRQQIDRLKNKPPCAPELLDYHYAVTYGGQKREKSRERQLLAALKSWERDLAKK